MIRANLSFNYYYPFYSFRSRGKKKYFYIEDVYLHLSREKVYQFTFDYKNGKLSSVKMDLLKNNKSWFMEKNEKHLSYTDFADKMRKFENFILRILRDLKNEKSFRRTMVFSDDFKFNQSSKIEFTYGKIRAAKGEFNMKIVNGKMIKEKDTSLYDSELMNKTSEFLNAWDSNYTFKEISKEKFSDDLDHVMQSYIPYLEPPKFLRKKEYEI